MGGWSLASTTVRGESTGVDRPAYFFGAMDHGMVIVRHRFLWFRPSYEAIGLDRTGRLLGVAPIVVPEAFVATYPFRRLIMAPVRFGEEWAGRIFVFEPRRNVPLIELAEFLQTLIRQVGPAVFSVHLQNQLQAKAGALERARVARELHDGVIQSLISVEMQLEVMRGQDPVRTTPAADDLLRLQHVVRNEVLNLRDLMQQMRPAEFDPRSCSITRDMAMSGEIPAWPRDSSRTCEVARTVTCFELVRIVQKRYEHPQTQRREPRGRPVRRRA
jgi:hypothetical protein